VKENNNNTRKNEEKEANKEGSVCVARMTLTKQEKNKTFLVPSPLHFHSTSSVELGDAFSFFPSVETSTPFPQVVNHHSDFGCREKRRRDSVGKVDKLGYVCLFSRESPQVIFPPHHLTSSSNPLARLKSFLKEFAWVERLFPCGGRGSWK